MPRLIDADALEKKIVKRGAYKIRTDDVIALIADAPTIDAVPVVRCRKCKIKSECMEYEIKKIDDFFCGYGERKENNNNE